MRPSARLQPVPAQAVNADDWGIVKGRPEALSIRSSCLHKGLRRYSTNSKKNRKSLGQLGARRGTLPSKVTRPKATIRRSDAKGRFCPISSTSATSAPPKPRTEFHPKIASRQKSPPAPLYVKCRFFSPTPIKYRFTLPITGVIGRYAVAAPTRIKVGT